MAGPNAERDQQIAAKARLGQSHEAIAAEYKLSRARISQIVAAANPRSPEEAQRQLIAARLRSRWDELEKIVRQPPEMHSAIGKIIYGSDGKPIINASAITSAIKTQLAIEAQYRAMFGVDIGTVPATSREQAARESDAILAELRAQRTAELRELEDLRALAANRPALPAPYIHAEVIR